MNNNELNEKIIKYLINNKGNYSDTYFYDLGKRLPFLDRIIYDYYMKNNQDYPKSYIIYLNEQLLINKLIENKELTYIVDNLDSILRKKQDSDTESLHEEVLLLLKSNINELTDKDIYKIYYSISKYVSLHSEDEKEILEIEKMLLDVSNKESTSILNIKSVYKGGFSRVFRINNTIIKVGIKRACERIADNNRILIPRFKNYIGSKLVEITDYCDTKKISQEDLYLIYEELRNQGVMWFDPFERNIGIINNNLIKEQYKRRNNLNNLGIISNPNKSDTILKDGDYVIIDLDHLVFDYDEEKINKLRNKLDEETEQRLYYFEKRYKKEKELLIKNK